MPALPLDSATARTTRARIHRRTDGLIVTARQLGEQADVRNRPACPVELEHVRALLALREAAHAYTRHRSERTRARVLVASIRLACVVAPNYTQHMAARVEPQLGRLEGGGAFRWAMAARRRAASVELVATAWRGTTLCVAPLVGTAWRDLTRVQRGRLEAAYGTHSRGSHLWRLRTVLQPRREHRKRDTNRRIAQVAREVLMPADPDLAAFIRVHAFAIPDDPPLRDSVLGMPAMLAHLPADASQRTDSALYALTDAIDRVRE